MMRNLKLNFFLRTPPSPEAAPSPEVVPDSARLETTTPHQRTGEALDLFEADVTRIVAAMQADINLVRDHSLGSVEHLAGVHDAMQKLLASSERIDHEITSIVHSSDELTAAADEISTTVSDVQQRAVTTLRSADESAAQIQSLGAAVSEIGGLLNSISEIATRTNLLALNATIEAARAGEAGRGFAVVAGEVKALSVAAGQSVGAIRARMDALMLASNNAIANMQRIREEIGGLTPICNTIADAAQEQRATIDNLSSRMQIAQGAVSDVAASVRAVGAMTDEAVKVSTGAADRSVHASTEAEDLRRRVVTILRTMPSADRRQFERLPIDLAMRVRVPGGEMLACRSFDLSEGGVLIRPQDNLKLVTGSSLVADISRIGEVGLNIVNVSAMGTHCRFERLSAASTEAVGKVLAGFRAENAPLIDKAQAFAREITAAIEAEITSGRLSLEAVFDTAYSPVPDTDPVQFRTRYLERFEAILPPIIERTLTERPNMVFCLATDRNGYIPVHIRKVSQPQRKGDRAWNLANCRNRRIFDDRAGLLAARISRPYQFQAYHRDMGNGVKVAMMEIDAPLVIQGRHWGGVRMAYST